MPTAGCARVLALVSAFRAENGQWRNLAQARRWIRDREGICTFAVHCTIFRWASANYRAPAARISQKVFDINWLCSGTVIADRGAKDRCTDDD